MNTTIPAVVLSTSDVAAIARLRAECKPWVVIAHKLEIPVELLPNFDLLPMFHPDWPAAYAAANKSAEADAFAEAQLVTRRLMQFATDSKYRFAAIRRAGRRTGRSRPVSKELPLIVLPGTALEYRLKRGETLESIARAYLLGISGGFATRVTTPPAVEPPAEAG